MAQIVQISKKATIIEGSQSEIDEIRKKLHDLGFNFENYQYIELKVDEKPTSNISFLNNQQNPTPAPQPKPASVSKPSSEPKPAPQPKPASEPKPAPEPKPAENKPAPQSGFSYEVTPIEGGYQIFIPQSKMDQVLKNFPIVRNRQKNKISKPNPDNPDGNYFFTLKQPYVEFKIYPPEDNVDQHHVIEVALNLLSLNK